MSVTIAKLTENELRIRNFQLSHEESELFARPVVSISSELAYLWKNLFIYTQLIVKFHRHDLN